jgi:hypothetical protein
MGRVINYLNRISVALIVSENCSAKSNERRTMAARIRRNENLRANQWANCKEFALRHISHIPTLFQGLFRFPIGGAWATVQWAWFGMVASDLIPAITLADFSFAATEWAGDEFHFFSLSNRSQHFSLSG